MINIGMEEVMWELFGEDASEQGLPPGFRFHPTDEELITFYLASKVFNGGLCGVDIMEVDLNKCEPWELPDMAKMGDKEWYFFSLRDRKYPTGLRTNRATGAGYWKATGKDREVRSATTGALVGMKKTLVFYKGRAPRGEKTKWVLHEYRLDGDLSCRLTSKEEWVICRILHKSGTDKKSPYYQNPTCFLDPLTNSTTTSCLPSFVDLQTQQTPTTPVIPFLHCPQSFQPCFPATSGANTAPKEEASSSSVSSFLLEACLQTPFLCDMGLGPHGLHFEIPTPHDVVPLGGPTYMGSSGPLVL